MLRTYKNAFIGLAAAALLVTGVATAAHVELVAPEAQREKNLNRGEKEAKKLLLLMDKDRNGKVSREEFMNFMSSEFDRMDKDHNGELDVHELTEAPIHSSGAIHR